MSVNENSAQPEVAAGTHDHIHPGLALLVICGAQLMIILDATIVNIALPSMQRALHFSATNLSWVLTRTRSRSAACSCWGAAAVTSSAAGACSSPAS